MCYIRHCSHLEVQWVYAQYADTVSVCFSKGLGAPYGSMLMGTKETINKARRFRIWLGGGVHQIGMQAAGAYYAIRNNLQRLTEDHQLAQYFAKCLLEIPEISLNVKTVETNMVQFSVNGDLENSMRFLEECSEQGLLLFPWVPQVFRAVFHQHISELHLEKAILIIKNVLFNYKSKPVL